MTIPTTIKKLTESFEKLPGVGPKTAQRLTFYLLHVPQGELDKFSHSVQNLKKDTGTNSPDRARARTGEPNRA